MPYNENAEVTTFEFWAAILSYCFCSFSMLLINKYVVTNMPYPAVVMTIQLGASTLFVYIANRLHFIEVEKFDYNTMRAYFVYSFSFVGGLYTSMKALSVANVETIIVFRSCLPLVISILDYLYLGRSIPNTRSMIALFCLVIGGYGYVASDSEFSLHGIQAYTWVMIWFGFMCFSMTYGKGITQKFKLSTWGSVQYNNVMSIPFLLFLGIYTGEFSQFIENDIFSQLDSQSTFGLFMSCAVGIGISYTGWWCRQVVSATTYTLIGVINKFGTVTANILIWDKHASTTGLIFLSLCLLASTAYQQAPLRQPTSGTLPI